MGPGKGRSNIGITIFEEMNMGINNWDVDKKEGLAKEFQRAGKLTGFENVKK